MFKNFTFWEAIKIGGPVMYLLILSSIVSIAIVIDRLLSFYKKSRIPRAVFMQSIRDQLSRGDTKKALAFCDEVKTPFSSVVAVALKNPQQDEKELKAALERQVIIEASELESRIGIVGSIGGTAVYVGLLGTVMGIIHTFQDIAQLGSGGIDVVIRGIAEALVCTAAGLFVAIPAVVAYNYFVKRVSNFVMDMELCASEIVSLLKGKA